MINRQRTCLTVQVVQMPIQGQVNQLRAKKGTKQHSKREKQPRKRSRESSEELMDTSNIDSSSSEEDQSSQKKKRLKLWDIFDMSSDSDSSLSNSDDSFALGILADSIAPQLWKI